MSITRSDGRAPLDVRYPQIKYNSVPNEISLQYQVNNNLLVMQLLQSKKIQVQLDAASCAGLQKWQLRATQSMMQRCLQQITQDCFELHVTVLAADRSFQTHCFNAAVMLLAQSGFTLTSLPFAVTVLQKENLILLDDEQYNLLFIADCEKIIWAQGSGLQMESLDQVSDVVKGGVSSLGDWLKTQMMGKQ